MRQWIINNRLYLAGAVVGALGGFLYWKLVGCSSGTCAITSKPFNSTAYFAAMGALLFGIFKKEKKQNETQELH